MIPRRVSLPGVSHPGSVPGVSYPGESLFSTFKFEYLSEISTIIENILTHRSVTQTGSNEEKTGGRKSRWTVPLINFSLKSRNEKNLLNLTINPVLLKL